MSRASPPPRSWELATWPAEIWPHDPKRGQWIGRAYRKELLAAGAMTRIGMKLVFIGAKYEKWLEGRAHHVVEFQSNNPALGKPFMHATESAIALANQMIKDD